MLKNSGLVVSCTVVLVSVMSMFLIGRFLGILFPARSITWIDLALMGGCVGFVIVDLKAIRESCSIRSSYTANRVPFHFLNFYIIATIATAGSSVPWFFYTFGYSADYHSNLWLLCSIVISAIGLFAGGIVVVGEGFLAFRDEVVYKPNDTFYYFPWGSHVNWLENEVEIIGELYTQFSDKLWKNISFLVYVDITWHTYPLSKKKEDVLDSVHTKICSWIIEKSPTTTLGDFIKMAESSEKKQVEMSLCGSATITWSHMTVKVIS